ncbi:MAG: ammonium transporter [Polycyclovorans sp.]|jgi:ammonium transporter, Amt family|nr:ammonium transporter [Gammaproteobacteria bacterium]MEC8849097.1 ammonium transporter [Pseudomonadota bacterium]|tara:strand:- start:43540 stop:44832 length:1293 start_codon:yes stop_codon:yes gene_type:complete
MRRLILLAGLMALPTLAWSQDAQPDTGDTAWIMAATALVLFMTLPGLALFYGGLVRTKNVLSVLMQCFVICCLATMIWVTVGYSLAFSGGNGFIGDLSRAMLSGIGEDTLSGTIPESLFAMFQMTFAIITPALVVGGFAERIKFSAMLWFSALWLLAVYIPVTHWVWASEGWLFKLGLLDFAGGTVVHVTAGVAALVAAIVLGPRRGFQTTPMLPHNMTMTVTGAAMLWVGWFGFNGGSALSAGGNAAMAMLVTHISAAAGALAWSVAEWKRYGKPSALGTVTGMVAGLGTITPASGFVGPGGAIVIGLTAGVVCFAATNVLKRVLKIDDSLDVFPVHGVGGILGTVAAGIFASDALGVFSGQGYATGMGMGSQLGVQALGVLATGAYTAVVTYGLFKLVRVLAGGLRVSSDEELVGLDQVSHNERGYDL